MKATRKFEKKKRNKVALSIQDRQKQEKEARDLLAEEKKKKNPEQKKIEKINDFQKLIKNKLTVKLAEEYNTYTVGQSHGLIEKNDKLKINHHFKPYRSIFNNLTTGYLVKTGENVVVTIVIVNK